MTTPGSKLPPFHYASRLELMIVADDDRDPGGEPYRSAHEGLRQMARDALAARGADLPRLRKQVAAMTEAVRALSDADVTMAAIGEDEAGLWHLALRECERREAERGYPLGWTRDAWERYEREAAERIADLDAMCAPKSAGN